MSYLTNDKLSQGTDDQQMAKAEARYDRIAPIYDLMEVLPDQRFRSWREKMWAQVPVGQLLEVGVGTGKNLPYHLPGVQVVGIDISQRMLQRAQQRAEEPPMGASAFIPTAQSGGAARRW